MNVLVIGFPETLRFDFNQQLQACDIEVSITEADRKGDAPEGNYAAEFVLLSDDLAELESVETNDLDSAEDRASQRFAIAKRVDNQVIAAAFKAGYDDCFAIDCDTNQLNKALLHIDEVARIEARLAQAQKLESIGELAAGIAHEINTPIQYVGDNARFVRSAFDDLGTVLDHCVALLANPESGKPNGDALQALSDAVDEADVEYLVEEVPSAIDQTLEGVERVSNIVRAMKEFAHPGASEMTPVDLARAIDNTLMVAKNEWKYVAEVETDFDLSLPMVSCLPGELNQVLLNMIVNAAHAIGSANGESGNKGTIAVSTRRNGDFAEILIIDTGTGIKEEHLQKVFQPFFTTKGVGKGTGQGLAIAHSVIVDKHGGEIDVASRPGKGSTFTIRLPIERNQELEEDVQDATLASV